MLKIYLWLLAVFAVCTIGAIACAWTAQTYGWWVLPVFAVSVACAAWVIWKGMDID